MLTRQESPLRSLMNCGAPPFARNPSSLGCLRRSYWQRLGRRLHLGRPRVEQANGIEPLSATWKAAGLPLTYACVIL